MKMVRVFYDFLFIIPFAFAGYLMTLHYLFQGQMTVWKVLGVFFLSGLVIVFKNLRLKGRIISSLVVLIFITGVSLTIYWSDLEVTRDMVFGILLFVGILFGMLVIAYFISFFQWAKRVLAMLLVAALMVGYFLEFRCEMIENMLLFYLIFFVFIEEMQIWWVKAGETDLIRHMVSTAPFLVVFCAALCFCKAPEDPYDWRVVQNIYNKGEEVLVLLSEKFLHSWDEDFDISGIGFSEKGTMAGRVSETDREIMVLKSGYPDNKPIYLSGKVFDTFFKGEWICEKETGYDERMMDTLELLAALDAYDYGNRQDYIHKITMEIEFLRYTTKFLFTPIKTSEFRLNGQPYTPKENGGTYTFDSRMGYQTKYETNFYVLNMNHPNWTEIVKESPVIDEQNWVEYQSQYSLMKDSRFSFESYLSYKQAMREKYLPKMELSEKMQSIVDTIYTSADNDLERLETLQSILQDMEYNRNPGELPDSIETESDYLEYFLLSSQKGYCIHYATTFVLMARAMNIPARYVQGYYVKTGNQKSTVVKSNMAHAWAEVYLNGMGWVTFDATPGFYEPITWKVKGNEAEAQGGNAAGPERDERTFEGLDIDELLDSEEEIPEEDKSLHMNVGLIVTTILICVLLPIAVYIFDFFNCRRKLKKMQGSEKLKRYCKWNLSLLELTGGKREETETLQEYAKRLEETMGTEELGFIPVFEKYIYAQFTPDETCDKLVLTSNQCLLNTLKEQKKYSYPIYYVKAIRAAIR